MTKSFKRFDPILAVYIVPVFITCSNDLVFDNKFMIDPFPIKVISVCRVPQAIILFRRFLRDVYTQHTIHLYSLLTIEYFLFKMFPLLEEVRTLLCLPLYAFVLIISIQPPSDFPSLN